MNDEVQRLVQTVKSVIKSLCLGHGPRKTIKKPPLFCSDLAKLTVDELDDDLVGDKGAVLHFFGGPFANIGSLGNVFAKEITAGDSADLKVVLNPA